MTLDETLKRISKPNESEMKKAKTRLDKMAKPLGSFGELENIIIKSAGILEENNISFKKKCVVVFCADNGVTAEGVSQATSDVTAIVAEKISQGKGNISCVSRAVGADVFAVDVGMEKDVDSQFLEIKKVSHGTKNIRTSPAMTKEECVKAIEIGINKAEELAKKGYDLFSAGEMGIGNTTTTLAVCSCVLGLEPKTLVGSGAGLEPALISKKAEVAKLAIEKNKPNPLDPIDVLSKLGGFDICAMTGFYLGAAALKKPVILDGVISSAAALCSFLFNEDVVSYLFPSHLSKEKAMLEVLKKLNLSPILNLGMYLGEGTGAVCAMPLFDIAERIYKEMGSFNDFNIEQYQDYRGQEK